MFLNKIFTTRQILIWKIYNASDFDLKFLQRVRFWNKIFSSCQISDQLFTTRQILKRNILPKSITGTFHIAFLHVTMYSYMLQYLRQLDNSIHHRSNNTSCILHCKDFHCWFRYSVPLSSLNLLDICKNELLLIVTL